MSYIFDIPEDDPPTVEPKVEDEDEEVDDWAPGEPGLRRILIPIDLSKCGILIGTKGATIKKIRSTSGADVFVDDVKGEVEITGELRQVKKAERMVNEVTAEPEWKHKSSIPIPRSKFPLLIGTRGSTIIKIRITSGADVTLDEIKAIVRIAGEQEQVKVAEKMVRDVLERELFVQRK